MSIVTIFILSYAVYLLISDIKKWRKWNNVTIPKQLICLVQQAHSGQAFHTVLNISVGADMREKLCYPLTPEQVEAIRTISYLPQENRFDYRLSSYKSTDCELSGIVLVTIKYRDELKKLNLEYVEVPIRIECRSRPGEGWKVHSVEYL